MREGSAVAFRDPHSAGAHPTRSAGILAGCSAGVLARTSSPAKSCPVAPHLVNPATDLNAIYPTHSKQDIFFANFADYFAQIPKLFSVQETGSALQPSFSWGPLEN